MFKDFDFKNKSIDSNLKLLALKLEESIYENNEITKRTGKLIVSNFFYSLSEGIRYKTQLLYQMQGLYFEDKMESISLELNNIKYDIDNFNDKDIIDFNSIHNIALNYADEYFNELANLINNIKENQFIDCDECNSLMEYLEEHQSYCCSNEDCNHEIGF